MANPVQITQDSDGTFIVNEPGQSPQKLTRNWKDLDQLRTRWQEAKRWTPNMTVEERERQLKLWKKAVTRTLDWVEVD
jgi:glycerol kinase